MIAGEDASAGRIPTTCPYCGVGCGVLAERRRDGMVTIAGDPQHPANHGRLCSKGAALDETLTLSGRLLHPQVNGVRVTWDEALDQVAQGLRRIVERDGADAIALYVSGQLLSEDYYVANKLMKGFIGTANIDTNSRLCMSSAVAGHKRAFGEDVVPVCYEDIDHADLIVLVGSNTAWCHPVLFQRMTAAKARRSEVRIVVIDPRRTATCEFADLHLPIRAGTDVWLFNGLLAYLHQQGSHDRDFVATHTNGADDALAVAHESAGEIAHVASVCGLDVQQLLAFYELFRATERTLTVFSQGVNQSSAGTDKVSSIINCHLLTGRIGRPGMGPFSITGQPNAMGGREVGGLANTLAAHLELGNEAHRASVQRFWRSPKIATREGLKAVELFDAIHDGRIKAVWIMGTNPVVSLPDADKVKEALRRCELLIVSDCVQHTDTTACAHVLLPAAAWGEKEGTVTNSERRISRQRAFAPLPGEARPDWWIVSQVAQRMGFARDFDFTTPAAIFREHAALSSVETAEQRAFDIGALAQLRDDEYDALEPIQWPVRVEHERLAGTARLFDHRRYSHPDGKARFIATVPRAPWHSPDETFPLILNTGRVRDQWHTMTRTGVSPRLTSHSPQPYADLHPHEALRAGLREGELVQVTTQWGALVVRLRTSAEVPRGMVFVPIHWSDAFASDARVGALVNPIVDPVSGEPEFKHTPARVRPFFVNWHGFMLSRQARSMPDATWWARTQGAQCVRYEFALRAKPPDWSAWARHAVGAHAGNAQWLECRDEGAGVYRAAMMVGGRIEACLFIASRPDLPSRGWLMSLFARETLDESERRGLLAGRLANRAANAGPNVCSCFGVGRQTIIDAITRHGLKTPQEIGKRLRAGSNCGSCLGELKALLAEVAAHA